MKITVAGLGYVGTALAIALSKKYEVRAIDVDEGKVSFLRNGHSPIGDDETQKAIDKLDKLPFVTDDPALAYPASDVVVIATSTNYDPELNSFDTSHVEEVIGEISNRCPDATVVIKSTVPVVSSLCLCPRVPEGIPRLSRHGFPFPHRSRLGQRRR